MSNLMKTLTIGDASYEICDASARETLKNTVKSINGATPDENGNIEIGVTSSGGSGGDWNQMDEAASDFIKNKTHYDAGRPVEFPIFTGESMAFTESPNEDNIGITYMYEMQESDVFTLVAGNTYYVTIDGETHTAQAMSMGGESVYIGNLSIVASVYPNTGEPFFIMPSAGLFGLNIVGETHNISISEIRNVVEKDIITDGEYTFSVMNPDMIPMLINIGGFDLSSITEGDLYNVTFDGVEYQNTVTTMFDGPLVFGNLNLMSSDEEDTGEPYLALYSEGISGMYAITQSIQAKFSIDKTLSDGTYENIVPDGTRELVGAEGGYQWADTELVYVLEENTSYKVIWNGIEYACASVSQNMGSEEEPMIVVYIGNLSKIGMSDTDTGEPFIFGYVLGEGLAALVIPDETFTDTHQIKVVGYVSGVKKLDKKYLPDHEHDIPVASYDEIGGIKVGSTTSNDLSSNSNYLGTTLSTYDNKLYISKPSVPTSLPNPYYLTFTGGVTGSYNGSASKTVHIPTALKNPNALTFTGAASGSYDGSSAKTVNIPTVPTALKNPNALTFTGLIEGAYDGSEAVNIEIPTGLPEVNTENNDQILQVVDGVWKANNPVFNYTTYIDQGNGYKYYVYMYNGELIVQAECVGIEIVQMPDKMTYKLLEKVDITGMVVNAILADGSTKKITDYTVSDNTLTSDNATVTVSYSEFGCQSVTTTFNVTIDDSKFIDFTYTVNNDNSVTLNTWKGTLNGETSTECVIPDGDGIIDIII